MLDYLKERLSPKTIMKEVGQMLDQKVAQGAAELSQALNSQSNAYVPYGAGQKPLEVLEVQGPQQSYQEMIREQGSQARPQEMDNGMSR